MNGSPHLARPAGRWGFIILWGNFLLSFSTCRPAFSPEIKLARARRIRAIVRPCRNAYRSLDSSTFLARSLRVSASVRQSAARRPVFTLAATVRAEQFVSVMTRKRKRKRERERERERGWRRKVRLTGIAKLQLVQTDVIRTSYFSSIPRERGCVRQLPRRLR